MSKPISNPISAWTRKGFMLLWLGVPMAGHALTLGDVPTTYTPPPTNVLLTPSVEYPTPSSQAHIGTYDGAKEYIGYFDPNKCYTYRGSADGSNDGSSGTGYFEADSFAGSNHSCSSWSGNALNYVSMGAIDTFRWAMTGGYRVIDEPSTGSRQGVTVLERSFQLPGYTELKNRAIPIPAAYGGGTKVLGSDDHTFYTDTSTLKYPNRLSLNNGEYQYYFYPRVRVCDSRKGNEYLEANCQAYQNADGTIVTYKPVGLIQLYQDKMRFGLFSYLLNQTKEQMFKGAKIYYPEWITDSIVDSTKAPYLDGAVLRARMKNVGPSKSDGTPNANMEWSPETGVFIRNPDPADGGMGGNANSGVINYLNKFGFENQAYEVYDQPSEMYAEALRYLMNKPPTYDYYKQADGGNGKNNLKVRAEGFPVITDWAKDDPIISMCQRNVIIGIGDINTHDENYFGALDFDPIDWTATVGGLEDISGLETQQWQTKNTDSKTNHGVERGGSNMIAGMAYYAHTNDLRPDLTKKAKTPQKVTVDTFWVDVMEKQSYKHRNQYWLAAKYGGLKTDESGDDQWWKNKRTYNGSKLPDNYYMASDAKAMVDGLSAIFAEAGKVDIIATGAGVAWSSNERGDATDFYRVLYYSKDWNGTLEWHKFNGFDSNGVAKTKKVWSAAENVDRQSLNDGRYIVTGSTKSEGSFVAVPFRFDKLSAAQKLALGANEENQKGVLEYLRGNRNGEGSKYRKRASVLGDIVHSTPVRVQAPAALYDDAHNPGYSDFKEKHKSRQEMVYVGANDGMLHAIVGGEHGGKEAWAYIPAMLFQGPSNPATPKIDGLQALSRLDYSHHYYVDAPPIVADVDFNRTGGKLSNFGNDKASDWRTVLVSGLGKGGKGFFALDVTNPDVKGEPAAADKVLWEFTDPDMGFSYGRPLITKTRAWGWVVILTSGYNNTANKLNPNAGKGMLYVLDVSTGKLLQKVNTGAGTISGEAGLVQVSGYTPSYVDYLTDYVYGGDLLGNLWRFDFTSDSDREPDLVKLAVLTDGEKTQPVTSPPLIEFVKDPGNKTQTLRWVLIGTGQWLSTDDINKGPGTQTQTMYAIRDGDRFTAGTKDNIKRGDLKEISNLTVGLDKVPDDGWRYDLTGMLDGGTERVTFSPVIVGNTVAWIGIMPQKVDNSAECKSDDIQGVSRFYAVDLATGKSQMKSGSKTSEFYETENLLFSLDVVQGKNGLTLAGATVNGDVVSPTDDPLDGGSAGGRPSRRGVINWFTIE